ncbi:MAG TPA: insulinase family protein [Thermoanaerobaculia bacterium]|nr:insulinase family protein [Thermoanaerobaculia bacterium]
MSLASRLLAVFLLLAAGRLAAARLDSVVLERLPNGLTVMVLEDPTLPVVSTQVLYKAGGRNEHTGATGVAHFLEHMAFRATERFPDTDVVSRIYAVGGEWHAYTWIDQTTYFETVPREHLPLVLDIQADRMSRLLLPPAEMEAERGAVLTELHGYENDPASVLHDAVAAVSFTQHPYRQNVIGWTSDVERITHGDVAAFYRRHYNPANAVLAIAGDVKASEALALVRRAFGGIPAGEATPLPHTEEPPQQGERRVDLPGGLPGGGTGRWFQIAYRAPAASDPDLPAFLLIQALLTGSSGASFLQDGDPFPARPGSRLHGVGEEIASAFSPTAQPYLFSLRGRGGPEVEQEIEERIAALRDRPVPAGELDRTRRSLLTELELDAESTEDAAHQMAFYEGIGAFGVLQRLPGLIAAVTPEDVRRAAASRLQPYQRTIGWVHPVPPPKPVASASPAVPEDRPLAAPVPAPPSAPRVKVLPNGIALIVRRVPRVPAGYLRVVTQGNGLGFPETGLNVAADEPLWRHTSLGLRFRVGELDGAIVEIRKALESAVPEPIEEPDDPEALLERTLRGALGIEPVSGGSPVAVVAMGDFNEDEALRLLESAFSSLPRRRPLPRATLKVKQPKAWIALPGKAQSQIGYAVPVPSSPLAWRMLLYVMAHDYEGRLGKELISRRGLAYYLGTRHHTDGQAGWLSITTGVNPDKLDEARALFFGGLDALLQHPPTEAEVEEARQHLIGRRLTAPMSNEEMSAAYAREWIERGRLLTDAEWEREVRAVTREEILEIVPAFLAGVRGTVDVRPTAP